MNDWPGVAATPGDKTITFQARQGAGSISTVTVTVQWYDSEEDLLQTNNVSINDLSSDWKRGSITVTAPTGTAFVRLLPNSDEGSVSDSVYLDGFVVADADN